MDSNKINVNKLVSPTFKAENTSSLSCYLPIMKYNIQVNMTLGSNRMGSKSENNFPKK